MGDSGETATHRNAEMQILAFFIGWLQAAKSVHHELRTAKVMFFREISKQVHTKKMSNKTRLNLNYSSSSLLRCGRDSNPRPPA